MTTRIEPSQIEKLVEKIRAVVEEINWHAGYGNWAILSDALEAKGILTISGAHWYHARGGAMNLKRFIKTHCSDLLFEKAEMRKTKPLATRKNTKSKPAPPLAPPELPQNKIDEIERDANRVSLDQETVELLKEMALWWKGKRQREAEPLYRPRFKGGMTNTGIRIPKELLEAAKIKAGGREQRARTGGNLSSLIAVLLWEYLDYDQRFVQVEGEPPEE